MRIAVVGAGGVGGYMAAKLSEVYDVVLLSKSLQRLKLIENGQKRSYHPRILSEPDGIYDLVIFATKSTVLEPRAKELQDHLGAKSIILPLLNGIEPYKKLQSLFPSSRVLKGAIYIISHRIAPDTIELKGKGALVVAEPDETLAKIFQKAAIKYKMPEEIDRAIWQKYLFIAATAALTTLYDATFGEVAQNHMEEFVALLEEIRRIANKKGVHLDESDVKRAVTLLQKSPPKAKTSMQLDFERKNPGELDNLIGYLAKESKTFAMLHTKLSQKAAQ